MYSNARCFAIVPLRDLSHSHIITFPSSDPDTIFSHNLANPRHVKFFVCPCERCYVSSLQSPIGISITRVLSTSRKNGEIGIKYAFRVHFSTLCKYLSTITFDFLALPRRPHTWN